jgi:hypothetical protein
MKIYNELDFLGFFKWLSETHNLKDTDMTPEFLDELPLNDIRRTMYNSMAFRWFREKYNMYSEIEHSFYIGISDDLFEISCYIAPYENIYYDLNKYKTHKEAELGCLKKLIEICRQLK